MRFELKTLVHGNHKSVFKRFDLGLFHALTPPFSKLNVKKFEGDTVGGKVELDIEFFGLIKQQWQNEITEYKPGDKKSYFVDEGREIPFPLKTWKHTHIVNDVEGKNSEIVDSIDYSTGTILTDILFFPAIWSQFAMRKPIYRKYFSK